MLAECIIRYFFLIFGIRDGSIEMGRIVTESVGLHIEYTLISFGSEAGFLTCPNRVPES